MIEYEHEVQQRIRDLEQLVERHELLGEMIAKSGQSSAPAVPGCPEQLARARPPARCPPRRRWKRSPAAPCRIWDSGPTPSPGSRRPASAVPSPSRHGPRSCTAARATLDRPGARGGAQAVSAIFTRTLDRTPGPLPVPVVPRRGAHRGRLGAPLPHCRHTGWSCSHPFSPAAKRRPQHRHASGPNRVVSYVFDFAGRRSPC